MLQRFVAALLLVLLAAPASHAGELLKIDL